MLRPGKNGGRITEIEIAQELADAHRLATGDVVEGLTEPMAAAPQTALSDEVMEDEAAWHEQYDEPASVARMTIPNWLTTHLFPTERITAITRINGLALDEAEERPSPRTRRSHSERTPPDRLLPLAVGPNDLTGRMLDFAASLGAGSVGVIWGPHGSGLTRTMRAVLKGLVTHTPDCVPIVLLLRTRSEEITDWRRQFPTADIVVCPSAQEVAATEQTLRMADLVLEAAQRQTELGRDVALLVDSLTGLWGAMLEAEAADAQSQADHSRARQRLREWVQRAGCFHGETPLGGSLGGSLTLLGTVWHQTIDEEAEEDRELHPHLRLMEHLLHETSWRVALSPKLAGLRLYPAIDVRDCLSSPEERLLPAPTFERLLAARGKLPRRDPLAAYLTLMDALEATESQEALLDVLLAAK